MALGFMQLAKLMKGGLGSDELAEMLGAMGLGADVTTLTAVQVQHAFQKLWEAGQEPGAAILRMELRKQNGEKMSGLLVIQNSTSLPEGQAEPSNGEKLLPEPA